MAYNVSRTGVLLVGPLPSAPAELAHLTLIAPRGDLQVRLQGRVVRRSTQGDDEDAVAFEFHELEPAQRDGLEALLSRVIEGKAPGSLEGLRPGAPPFEVKKALEAIPLPHRIALAARSGPREREFLRQDPHPQVLDSLSRNPGLLLSEAHAIAAVAHLLPTTLEHLVADLRWAQDDEIRILVLAHPRTPTPFADRLLAQLGPPMLKRLLQRNLSGALRDKAAKRLRQFSS